MEALEHEGPLHWIDGFYLESNNSCEFQDVNEVEKQITIQNNKWEITITNM